VSHLADHVTVDVPGAAPTIERPIEREPAR
jgi:hypothetical protein